MRFETSQSMKMGQQMKLAPRMIQSMEILQMPLAELEERLAAELESNPTLEMADGDGELQREEPARDEVAGVSGDVEAAPLRVDEEHGEADFERLDRYEQDNPDVAQNEFDDGPPGVASERRESDLEAGLRRTRLDGERDAKMDAFAQTPARSASMVEQLRGQWSLCDVDPKLRPLGELILQFTEEDGYLRTPLETIADRAPVGTSVNGDGEVRGAILKERPATQDLERALQALQLFLEPAGVCARNAGECLLLQLDSLEDEGHGWTGPVYEHARALVKDHLDDLMQNRLPRVAEKTGLSLDEIKEALTLLKRLSLAPGRRLVEASERPIVPDAIVEHDETQDRYIAYLNDSHLPTLRINEEYAKLTRDKAMEKRDREFIKTNLVNAQWLLDAVGQRRHTLLRVVNKVIEHQRDFFDFGPQALKPLPMTQVAEELGIHVATVSRAVSEKFVATPRGVMPLRKFFSGGLQTEGGEDMAWEAIRQALRELIDGEDKKKPLSDDALSDALKAKGMDIARRTVAKYRDQLGVPSARLRKTF